MAAAAAGMLSVHELAVIRGVPGFESRVKYLDGRVNAFRVELSKLFTKG